MRISRSDKKLVVLTGGDPRGIGPEVILKSINKFSSEEINILIIGDYSVFRSTAEILKIDISSIKPTRRETFVLKNEPVGFIDLKNASSVFIAKNDKACGRASMEYVLCGASIVKATRNSSLVTAPIQKASINKAGYKFEGHTEFLSHITKSKKVTMMLIGGNLKLSLVTRHLALKAVPKGVTKDKIVRTAENTHYALTKFFKIRHPKIGVAGLNPHAGENGLFGGEEKSVILPAIRYLRRKFVGIEGPFPPDTLFYKAKNGQFDAVVCMYHDQGLIPFKMLAFDKGVNLTIGLPFIRTSPDHGTAFDIAGKGRANPSSMIEAIKLAAKLS